MLTRCPLACPTLVVLAGIAACARPPAPAAPAPAAPAPAAPATEPAPDGDGDGRADIVIGTSIPLASQVFGDTRTINIYLPWGYEERPDERFPVLYLVDGGVKQDFHPMSGMAALATLSGQYREFILVGVQTENRYYELTAPSDVAEDVKRISNNGGAAEFRKHLLDEVKPYVAANYRSSGESAIIGESLAGLFITETFLRAPGSFDHYVAVSPSLWWRDMGLAREAPDLLARGEFSAKSFYLTVADEGGTMQEGADRVAAAVKSVAPTGLTWWYEPMPDEHHHTIYNPATLRALRRIFAKPDKR